MIDVFFRRDPQGELMHPRVCVTTAPDAVRAQELVETLNAHGVAAGGRPSRRRGTVAQLVKRRDTTLILEISAKRPGPRLVQLAGGPK